MNDVRRPLMMTNVCAFLVCNNFISKICYFHSLFGPFARSASTGEFTVSKLGNRDASCPRKGIIFSTRHFVSTLSTMHIVQAK